jgi:short-subunit dehydrogenase
MTHSRMGSALLTGASAGIGAIYADRLARRGYDLILVARRRDKLEDLANRIAQSTHSKISTIVADLNDKADLGRIETVLAGDPAITMLVNNAGIGSVDQLLKADVSKMESMIELNITALTRLTYAAAPAFAARGRGTIINLSSAVAIAPEILNGVYGATKAYVLAFSLSLHKELADRNVRIQAVLPGAIATNFWDVSGGSLGDLPSKAIMSPEDLVDAALAGLDQGELVTIPSLPDVADWNAYEAARQRLIPNLSLDIAPERYRIAVAA